MNYLTQKFNEQIRQRPHADSNALLAQMVTDIHDNLAIFLAPELLKYLKQQFSFLILWQPAMNHQFIKCILALGGITANLQS